MSNTTVKFPAPYQPFALILRAYGCSPNGARLRLKVMLNDLAAEEYMGIEQRRQATPNTPQADKNRDALTLCWPVGACLSLLSKHFQGVRGHHYFSPCMLGLHIFSTRLWSQPRKTLRAAQTHTPTKQREATTKNNRPQLQLTMVRILKFGSSIPLLITFLPYFRSGDRITVVHTCMWHRQRRLTPLAPVTIFASHHGHLCGCEVNTR